MQQIHQHTALFTDGCGRLFLVVEGRGQLIQGGILVGLYRDDSIAVVTGPHLWWPRLLFMAVEDLGKSGPQPITRSIVEPFDEGMLKHKHTLVSWDPNTIPLQSFLQQYTKKKSPSAEVVLLMDSNGKQLDTRRMFPGRRVSSVRCANTEQALQLLKRDTLGSPACIVIHTGTNDQRALQQHTTRAVRKVAVRATQEFPDSRVVISTLLPRADTPPHIITSINGDHQRMCHPTQRTPGTPASPGPLAPT
ncbi:hypothetical protein SKAU_G00178500 [Synaphobranchus kaupii]|uniref:Uncharacterized protein n=1 Tax=Synaphobranchus kaupii TaxID=118154 RepID=A0A9Q1FMD5_SYNKA|nr:hypothetical protein SKAU_G00178500 [Synaphobranchus kaupii]